MKIDWDILDREVDLWAAAGRRVELWWRDDDAIGDSGALYGLTDRPAPKALAVIPAKLQDSLKARLSGFSDVTVLQHGIEHRNLASATEKKSEFPSDRPVEEAIAGLLEGQVLLREVFPDLYRAVLVPPWNRICPDLVRALPGAGFLGLSTQGARQAHQPVPGLIQINTHVDVIDWKGGGGFIGRPRAIRLFADHLAAKRLGKADPAEPTGLLTHHLVHDTETWRFLDDLLSWREGRPEVIWLAASTLFPSTPVA